MEPPPGVTLLEWFGPLDVYLFDQLLEGRITARDRVLDAGCGGGRNLVYLLRMGCEVHAVDANPRAVAEVRELYRRLRPDLDAAVAAERVVAADVADLPNADGTFDVVLAIAVLHFARGESHFDAMLGELWRVVRPGGFLFARLASSIGIEDRIRPLGDGRHALPDGSERFLVDEARLLGAGERLGGDLLSPIKTTNVQGLRAMTTWCLRRRSAG